RRNSRQTEGLKPIELSCLIPIGLRTPRNLSVPVATCIDARCLPNGCRWGWRASTTNWLSSCRLFSCFAFHQGAEKSKNHQFNGISIGLFHRECGSGDDRHRHQLHFAEISQSIVCSNLEQLS